MPKHLSPYVSPLDRAIASGDPKLLAVNIANIVGHALKGRPRATVDSAIVHVYGEIVDMMKRNEGTTRNTGPYIYRTAQKIAIRYVMNPVNRYGCEVNNWDFGFTPDVQRHKSVEAEWLAVAKDDKERELLSTLYHTTKALTYTRKRFAELKQSQKRLVDRCANGVGLSPDVALACFNRVARDTIDDEALRLAQSVMNKVPR